jgi:hypothetical protein
MYLVSFQFLLIFVILLSTFDIFTLPEVFLKNWFSPMMWPQHLIKEMTRNTPQSLVKPHQIISNVVNNVILMLSFGLCSPVLSCYITLSTCATLLCWLMLIGRFVYCCIENQSAGGANADAGTGADADAGTNRSLESRQNDLLCEDQQNPISGLTSMSCDRDRHRDSGDNLRDIESEIEIGKDEEKASDSVRSTHPTTPLPQRPPILLCLLDEQLRGVRSSLSVCKWPVILTSCFFVTLFCWDMVGDEVGWEEGLWVPVAGVLMLLFVWIWDRFLVSHVIDLINRNHLSPLSKPSPHFESIELVESSIHQSLSSRFSIDSKP